MDLKHVTRSYIFIGGEGQLVSGSVDRSFRIGVHEWFGWVMQPLFKILIAESLQIDFFDTPRSLSPSQLVVSCLMNFIIITFFSTPGSRLIK